MAAKSQNFLEVVVGLPMSTPMTRVFPDGWMRSVKNQNGNDKRESISGYNRPKCVL